MSQLRFAATLAIAVFASGCLYNDAPALDGPRSDGKLIAGIDVTQPMTILNDSKHCMEHIVAVLTTFDHAQALLPKGFKAGDASLVLETPAPLGKALVFFNVWACSDNTFENASLLGSEPGILVEPPRVQADDPIEPADYHFYQLAMFSDGARVRHVLNAVNFTAFEATGQVSSSPTGPAGYSGSGELRDEKGALASFRVQGLAAEPTTGSFRFWHVGAAGVSYFTFNLDKIPVYNGITTECAVRSGTIYHTLLGTTSCPAGALALVIPQQAWTSTFRFHPGATVGETVK